MLRCNILSIFLAFSLLAGAQDWKVVRENPQKAFPKTVTAGNYSGIAHLHDDIYAVVEAELGFLVQPVLPLSDSGESQDRRTGTGREPWFYRENRWNAERRKVLAGAGERL